MKKTLVIIYVIVLLGVISLLTYEHFKKPKPKKMFTLLDAQNAIQAVEKKFGKTMAQTVEKMMRLETSNFKSKQYIQTGSAGMEAGKWSNIPTGATNGTIDFRDAHDNHIGHFIVWNSVTDFAMYLANYIIRHNYNFANWNTTNKANQLVYEKSVNSITSKFA